MTNANGIVQLAGGNFSINGTVTTTNVMFIGGVPGTNNVFQGGITWISGAWNGTTNTVTTNSFLVIAGGNGVNIDMASAVLTNFGTVAWNSGRLRGGQNGTFIYNFGLWNAQSDQTFNATEYGGATIFNNTGTLRKSAGATTNQTYFQGVTLNSPGPVNMQMGNLVLSGGGTLTGTTFTTGAGVVQLAGGTFTLIGNVIQSGSGQMQMNGAIMDGTNGVMLGNWSWTAGYFAPTARLTLATNSLMTIPGSGFMDLYGALTNAGTIQLQSGTFRPRADQGPGQLFILPGGLLDVQTDVLIDSFSGGSLLNQGTFRKSGGTNGTTVNPPFFNSGTVDVESSYLSFASGGSLSAGTAMTGPDTAYLSGGTFTLSGNLSLNNAAFNGSLIAGTNGSISGTVTWTSSGSYLVPASTLTVATNGVLVIADSGFDDLYGALTNAGTIQVVSGTFRPRADQGPGKLINLPGGLVDSKNDVTIDVYSGGTIINQGIFRKSVGTNSTAVNPALFNSGTLDAEVGNIALNGGVSLTNGSTMNFAISGISNYGTISIPGAASLTGTVSAVLKNGYIPIPTNTFNVLSYGSETGIFTATNLPFAEAWRTNYAPTIFSLVVLNTRPILVTPTNTLTVNELTTLTATNTATDPDTDSLTFSLVAPPPGMSIGSSSGILTWTPAQTNSPSTNTTTVVVTDSGVPQLSASNSFTVIVREVNVAPSLPVIATQIVNELTLLTVTNTATNSNIHATNIGYGLISAPVGMTISTNGIITWTPAQTNSPSTNTITTVVTNLDAYDLINSNLTSTNTFAVIVQEVNDPPTLSTISTQTVNELTLLTVTNTATEFNIHATTSGYLLLAAPPGMTISPAGIITWTPPQTNSPSTNVVTTIATNTDPFDTVNPHLSATNSFTVIVKEVNTSPAFSVISTQIVNELTLLTVTNAATNSNIHATNIGYGLINPPPGMAITANGVITWTPAQTNSPGTNLITTVVTNSDAFDSVNPHLTATNTFTVIVKEVNVAPVLSGISTQTVIELTLLTVTNTATESNIHATLGYLLVSPPAGAAISASGIITWTPAQTNSPGTNLFTTIVTNSDPFDTVNPHLAATNTFVVIVKEQNVAPVLPVIPTQTVTEQTLLTVTNTAVESNIHATNLSYSLISPPAGVSVSSNGIITWTPTHAQAGTTNTITATVSNTDPFDPVNPHLSATNSFTVIVAPAPVLFSPTWLGNGQFQFSFNSAAGARYTVFYSDDLSTWVELIAFNGPGGKANVIDPNAGASPRRFYRVKVGP